MHTQFITCSCNAQIFSNYLVQCTCIFITLSCIANVFDNCLIQYAKYFITFFHAICMYFITHCCNAHKFYNSPMHSTCVLKLSYDAVFSVWHVSFHVSLWVDENIYQYFVKATFNRSISLHWTKPLKSLWRIIVGHIFFRPWNSQHSEVNTKFIGKFYVCKWKAMFSTNSCSELCAHCNTSKRYSKLGELFESYNSTQVTL